MAGPLKIEYPGAVYRITARDNAWQNIFLEDSDRHRRFRVAVLSEIAENYQNGMIYQFD